MQIKCNENVLNSLSLFSVSETVFLDTYSGEDEEMTKVTQVSENKVEWVLFFT